MYDKQKILKGISVQDEKIEFAKVLDQIDTCLKRHVFVFTGFLSPAMLLKVEELNISEVNFKLYGGFEEAERKMVGICPDFSEISEQDFPLVALKIKLLDRFSDKLTHREYLGSILGTGIERVKLGDILVFEGYAIAFIEKNISEYVSLNLKKVSHIKVENTIIEIENIELPQREIKMVAVTVASLRIDAVASAVFHISRAKASELIDAEKVNLNWRPVKNGAVLLKEEDVFTLRGYGRAKVKELTGMTRKQRIGLTVQIY